MCIEAWLDGCVERLLGIFVVKVPIFLVRCSYLLCDGSWKNFLPLFCRMFSLYSIECISPLLSVVSLFFYQLFLSFVSCFSFLSIGCFSFLVVEGCVCFLFIAHFWSRAHILMRAPYRTFSCYLFLTSDLHFLHAQSVVLWLRSGLINCVRKVKRKNPVSVTHNPVNHNCLLHPCEGWRRKTKNSWRARMRVGLGQRFFTGKQIAAVRRIIYLTNWEERLNHCYSYLVLARSDALPASVVCLLCAVDKERKTTFCVWVSGWSGKTTEETNITNCP